jgi:NAD(P)-dependent dehydrogenase (short-subunit alcohol dehydrogenase family)
LPAEATAGHRKGIDAMIERSTGPLFVTGGARGIGAATVRMAAARGRPVAFSYAASDAAAQALCAAVEAAGGRVMAFRGDMADEAAVEAFFAAATARFGRPAAVFANAGITGPAGRLADFDTAALRRVMDVNVIGTFLTARAAVRAMSTARGGAGGALVLMSSRAARLGGPGEWIGYAASKGAVDTLTVGLSKEAGPEGIRVNAVAPGLIETEIHEPAGGPARLARLVGAVPLGRIGQPEEVAEAVLWLCSAAAGYVSGTVVEVGGGR